MAIAATLQRYLDDHGGTYNVVPHVPTVSSVATAKTCHVSEDWLAKGILLRDPDGYWLAVLGPAQDVFPIIRRHYQPV
jgi:Ala-tRNA(Pro) deacylase